MHIGLEGYLDLTRTAHGTATVSSGGIESINGLAVRGDPRPRSWPSVRSTGHAGRTSYAVGETLEAQGWYLDRQARPGCRTPCMRASARRLSGCSSTTSGTP